MGAVTSVFVLLQRGLHLESQKPVPLVDQQVEGVAVTKWGRYAPALPN